MKNFVTTSFAFILLIILAFTLPQSIAQENSPTASATSTAFIPDATQIHASLTAIPTYLPNLNISQERALESLMQLGSITYNPDGSIQSIITLTEEWLNNRIRPFLPLTGYSSDEVYLRIRREGASLQISHEGNLFLIHGGINISNNVPVLNLNWASYNGEPFDISNLSEQEAILNNLLALQTNALLNNNVFSYQIEHLHFYFGYVVLSASLRFREE